MINIAVIQMCSSESPSKNLKLIDKLILKAVQSSNNLDLICLPEYCYGVPNEENAHEIAEDIPGTFTYAISELAKAHKVNISAGSFVEKAKGKKNYNTSLFFNRDGVVIGKYRKAHLMDAMNYKESDSVSPGNTVAVFDSDFCRIGLMVCYDLRFPELSRTMTLMGAELILVPAAFPSGLPLPPRTDHWDVLTKSTALLNSVFVVAANQFGHDHGENYFGRSSVIDPWGIRIAQASGRQEIIFATIDLDYQKEIRESLSIWKNRRPDLYSL